MKAVKVQIGDGQIVFIETSAEVPITEGGGAGGGTIASPESRMAEDLGKLQEVGDAIAKVCATLRNQIGTSLSNSTPSELTLEFGVKLVGEVGIPFISKGSTEGTFQVSAKWDFK